MTRGFHSTLRILDIGGLIWESDEDDKTLADAEAALAETGFVGLT